MSPSESAGATANFGVAIKPPLSSHGRALETALGGRRNESRAASSIRFAPSRDDTPGPFPEQVLRSAGGDIGFAEQISEKCDSLAGNFWGLAPRFARRKISNRISKRLKEGYP